VATRDMDDRRVLAAAHSLDHAMAKGKAADGTGILGVRKPETTAKASASNPTRSRALRLVVTGAATPPRTTGTPLQAQ